MKIPQRTAEVRLVASTQTNPSPTGSWSPKIEVKLSKSMAWAARVRFTSTDLCTRRIEELEGEGDLLCVGIGDVQRCLGILKTRITGKRRPLVESGEVKNVRGSCEGDRSIHLGQRPGKAVAKLKEAGQVGPIRADSDPSLLHSLQTDLEKFRNFLV